MYGLAEAMRDVKRLKKGARAREDELQACLIKLNHRSQQMEDLLEENRWAPIDADETPLTVTERVH